MKDSSLRVLGWREWVSFPDHGIDWIKAKVDTGARTSSLHAFDLTTFERDGREWARFEVHPWQRSTSDVATIEAPVVDRRLVRPSTGKAQLRVVVRLPVVIAGRRVPVELSLTRRDEMGFRMLIGRQALRRRFLVDSGRSYVGDRPPRAARDANRGATRRKDDHG